MVGRHGSTLQAWWKLIGHIPNTSTKQSVTGKQGEAVNSQSPPAAMYFLQKVSTAFPNLGSSVQIPELLETFLLVSTAVSFLPRHPHCSAKPPACIIHPGKSRHLSTFTSVPKLQAMEASLTAAGRLHGFPLPSKLPLMEGRSPHSSVCTMGILRDYLKQPLHLRQTLSLWIKQKFPELYHSEHPCFHRISQLWCVDGSAGHGPTWQLEYQLLPICLSKGALWNMALFGLYNPLFLDFSYNHVQKNIQSFK